MKSWIAMAVLTGGMGLLLAGCGQQQQEEPGQQPGMTPGTVPGDTGAMMEDTSAVLSQQREEMLAQWQTRLDSLEQGMENLGSRLEQAPEQVRSEVAATMDSLQQRASELESRIEEAEGYSVEQWQSFQNEVDTAMTALQRQYEDVRGRI